MLYGQGNVQILVNKTAPIGSPLVFAIESGEPFAQYFVDFSFFGTENGYQLSSGRTIPLSPPWVYYQVDGNSLPQVFTGFNGLTDYGGNAAAVFNIPSWPFLSGLPFDTLFFTLDPFSNDYVGVISAPKQVTIVNSSGLAGPKLIPGTGFQGATPQPGDVGTGQYSTLEAIARWDMVPRRIYRSKGHIGVIAFHYNQIDRIEFSAEGGQWVSVRETRKNPDSQTWEYTIAVDPADFTQGIATIRAVVYPKNGRPRVLADLEVVMDGAGTLTSGIVHVTKTGNDTTGDGSPTNPFATPFRALQELNTLGGAPHYASGGTVLLGAGQYEFMRPSYGAAAPLTPTTWVTISSEPNVTVQDVALIDPFGGNSFSGMSTKYLRLKDVTVKTPVTTKTPLEDYLWLDNVVLQGNGPSDSRVYFSLAWWNAIYATDSVAKDMVNAFREVDLARNCLVDTVHADAFPGVKMIVNCEIRNQVGGVDNNGNPYHSDLWQDRTNLTPTDVIVYGLKATSNVTQQGIFTRSTGEHSGIAIVNCDIKLTGYPNQNQWRTRSHHFILRNNSFRGVPFLVALSDPQPVYDGYWGSTAADWSKNVFYKLTVIDPEGSSGTTTPSPSDISSGTRIRNNHFVTGTVGGLGATSGQSITKTRGAFGSAPPPPEVF